MRWGRHSHVPHNLLSPVGCEGLCDDKRIGYQEILSSAEMWWTVSVSSAGAEDVSC